MFQCVNDSTYNCFNVSANEEKWQIICLPEKVSGPVFFEVSPKLSPKLSSNIWKRHQTATRAISSKKIGDKFSLYPPM